MTSGESLCSRRIARIAARGESSIGTKAVSKWGRSVTEAGRTGEPESSRNETEDRKDTGGLLGDPPVNRMTANDFHGFVVKARKDLALDRDHDSPASSREVRNGRSAIGCRLGTATTSPSSSTRKMTTEPSHVERQELAAFKYRSDARFLGRIGDLALAVDLGEIGEFVG